jgi:hypothetical protein
VNAGDKREPFMVHRKFQDRMGYDWYVWGDTCVKPWIADDMADRKRLTDAELSAEAYRQSLRACAQSGIAWDEDGANLLILPGDAVTFGPVRVETSRLAVMNRFASLPHASAGDYQ